MDIVRKKLQGISAKASAGRSGSVVAARKSIRIKSPAWGG